jgi:hypothetical protein
MSHHMCETWSYIINYFFFYLLTFGFYTMISVHVSTLLIIIFLLFTQIWCFMILNMPYIY